jgi:hypothetical protein
LIPFLAIALGSLLALLDRSRLVDDRFIAFCAALAALLSIAAYAATFRTLMLGPSLPCFGFASGEDVYHPMTHPTSLICQWIYRHYGCSNHVTLLSARFAIQLARFANQLECYFYATLLPWR